MAGKTLTKEDQEFLAQCEEEFKDRFTENDEDFMKVFNSEPSKPPIIENWWTPNSGRRNDRRFNNRQRPYDRHENRDRGFQDRRPNYDSREIYNDRRENYNRQDNYQSRGYNDYHGHDDGQRRRY